MAGLPADTIPQLLLVCEQDVVLRQEILHRVDLIHTEASQNKRQITMVLLRFLLNDLDEGISTLVYSDFVLIILFTISNSGLPESFSAFVINPIGACLNIASVAFLNISACRAGELVKKSSRVLATAARCRLTAARCELTL